MLHCLEDKLRSGGKAPDLVRQDRAYRVSLNIIVPMQSSRNLKYMYLEVMACIYKLLVKRCVRIVRMSLPVEHGWNLREKVGTKTDCFLQRGPRSVSGPNSSSEVLTAAAHLHFFRETILGIRECKKQQQHCLEMLMSHTGSKC